MPQKKLLASALWLVLATTSFAETPSEKFQLGFYGNFIHTQEIPNALFYFDDIEKDDSFQLRKAMRSHDIDTIVLSSGGGSVYEGLQMAGIIHDKKLTTYVPKQGLFGEGNCASACAFMFLGGVNREAGGKLGVHQFYSSNSDSSAKIGEIQGGTQYTVGEIIGFLNDFDTPAFVFEKMFQQSDMYYFNKAELEQLGATEGTLSTSKTMKINAFIQNFVSEIEKLASKTVAAAPPQVQAPKKKMSEQQTDHVKVVDIPPIDAFAVPFANGDNKPLMSIVLIDAGADLDDAAVGLSALRSFPAPITFAVDSSLPDAVARMNKYRGEGFEVLAMIDFPDGATAGDAEFELNAVLNQMTEVVGVLEGVDNGMHVTREASEQATQILLLRGHGFVTQPNGLTTIAKLAKREGVPTSTVFRDFDSAGQSPTVIRRFLGQAAFRAGVERGVIMLGRLRAETIFALLLWSLDDRAARVSMAPISAVLKP